MKYLSPILFFTLQACGESVSDDNKVEDSDVKEDTGITDADGDGVPAGEDCNDDDPEVQFAEEEICDGIDNDCDGLIDSEDDDSGIVNTTYYLDEDGDGFGNPENAIEDCKTVDGYSEQSNDCDDTNPEINPEADEICDGVDNDCDDSDSFNGIDEDFALDGSLFFLDSDGDGFGNILEGTEEEIRNWDEEEYKNDEGQYLFVLSCQADPPMGYSTTQDDCDDNLSDVYPDAPEYCNEIDEDCDGETFDAESLDAIVQYEDADADGFGNPDVSTISCSSESGYVEDDTDCDDSNIDISPIADEICDEIDNNCDDIIDDDAVDQNLFYMDFDGDLYGTSAATMTTCEDALEGYVIAIIDGELAIEDCDDGNIEINIDATEVCDGNDNDCDGDVDNDDDTLDLTTQTTFFMDNDGDLFGDDDVSIQSCQAPDGYVDIAGDCVDSDININPSEDEICDNIDNDCDDLIDDADDSIDLTTTSIYYLDEDGDGVGVTEEAISLCTVPDGYGEIDGDCDDNAPGLNTLDIDEDGLSSCDGDCNDANASIPSQETDYTDDGLDQNCDGVDGIDADGDGIASVNSGGNDCNDEDASLNTLDEDNDGISSCQGDCDDNNILISPFVTDLVGNEIDDNCDGVDGTDLDGDGSANILSGGDDCDDSDSILNNIDVDGDGYTSCNGDCDDNIPVFNPDALDLFGDGFDQNCDGVDGIDNDKDGYAGEESGGVDCDDQNPLINPSVTEQCDDIDHNCDDNTVCNIDNDGDGFLSKDECDDDNAEVYPGAPELCNGIDDNCDLQIDNDPTDPLTFFVDADGDTQGGDVTVLACTLPEGASENNDDCDDSRADRYLGAPEVCDGVDNDCDDLIDDEDNDVDEDTVATYYLDTDGDGFGIPGDTISGCSLPDGYSGVNTDCNDDSNSGGAFIYPGAAEKDSLTECMKDADEDGFGDLSGSCYNISKSSSSSLFGSSSWYDSTLDIVRDGIVLQTITFEEGDNPEEQICFGGEEDVELSWNRGFPAFEYATFVINDSDGNEAISGGFEEELTTGVVGTLSPPESPYIPGTDCDDTPISGSDIHPEADEYCDDLDNDCNNLTDDNAMDGIEYYYDNDLDGYGDEIEFEILCGDTFGFTTDNTDCIDDDPNINPSMEEICDGIDNDCFNGIDDEDPNLTGILNEFYVDGDNDGYGNTSEIAEGCETPDGFSEFLGDCNDSNSQINPGVNEKCNGFDDDCDQKIDEKVTDGVVVYNDEDGDGFGNLIPFYVCPSDVEANQVETTGDCDDTNLEINPDADDICDGIDNNCSGDESDATDAMLYVSDNDRDGYPAEEDPVSSCETRLGTILYDSNQEKDCDDNDALRYPNQTEICDGIDNDCDGDIDAADSVLPEDFNQSYYVDTDGDGYGIGDVIEGCLASEEGYSSIDGDCDDSDANKAPNITEVCDGIDNDCDGDIDDSPADGIFAYIDEDGDGYGTAEQTAIVCSIGDGFSDTIGDCDDNNPNVNNFKEETIDTEDNDCDGLTDCDDDELWALDECVDACYTQELMSDLDISVTTPIADLNDRFTNTCSSSSFGDAAYHWTAPKEGCYTFDARGSASYSIEILEENCAGDPITDAATGEPLCSTSDVINTNLSSGESVVVVLDKTSSWSSSDFELEIYECVESNCNDGLDDDSDGLTDCDDDECAMDLACLPQSCPSLDLEDIEGENVFSGSLTNATVDNFDASCSSQGAEDVVVAWTAPSDGCATIDTENSSIDTILAVFDDCPLNGGSEIACDDDGGEGSLNFSSKLELDVIAGTEYYIGVDSWPSARNSIFDLSIAMSPYACGTVYEDCNDAIDNDLDGLIDCEDSDCSSECAETDCTDGIDNDSDSYIDCDDVECSDSLDCIESICDDGLDDDGDGQIDCDDSDCENNESCVEFKCDDGLDDDGDELIDCQDPDCIEDAICAGSYCLENDLGTTIGDDVVAQAGLEGITLSSDTMDDTFEGTCGGSFSGGGVDVAYNWEVPQDGCYAFDTSSSPNQTDTVLYLLEEDCSGTEFACDEDGGEGYTSYFTTELTAGSQYVVVVDGYSSFTSGDVILDIDYLSIACEETDCTDGIDEDEDGLIDCQDDDCSDLSICIESICDDGIDDENDGLTDCDDPDCEGNDACIESICDDGGDDDGDELIDCDDPDCEGNDACIESICDDGIDDDGDELTDCDDPDCFSSEACAASFCLENDLGTTIGDDVIAQAGLEGITLSSDTMDDTFEGTCGLSYGGVDVAYNWEVPQDGCYIFDTSSSPNQTDTVLYLLEEDCSGTEFACDEDGGEGFTSYFTTELTAGSQYVVVVDGYASSTSGDVILDIDYAGEFCPETDCDDELDNNGDGAIDCDDPSCGSDDSCIDICVDDFIEVEVPVGLGIYIGSNSETGDDRQLDCTNGEGGNDVVLAWTAPETGAYSFSTESSSFDTVIDIAEGCFSDSLACNDDEDFINGISTSRIDNFEAEAGDTYYITIDGYEDSSVGEIILDVYFEKELDCADELDNDNDGLLNCEDEDCLGQFGCSEVDCTDGVDDDFDELVDCEDDDCSFTTECASETCPSFSIGDEIGSNVLTGTLDVSPTNFFDVPSGCSSNAGGQDLLVEWTAPSTGCGTFDTRVGTMDTMLLLFNECPTENTLPLICDDDDGDGAQGGNTYTSYFQYNVVAGQTYLIGIDSWTYDQTDTFVLDLDIEVGVSCAP